MTRPWIVRRIDAVDAAQIDCLSDLLIDCVEGGASVSFMHPLTPDRARESGRTLLVLDAVTGGDAARLYERLGWVRVWDIPRYALMPRGGLCSKTVFYRNLER
jgi:hypothetical protein